MCSSDLLGQVETSTPPPSPPPSDLFTPAPGAPASPMPIAAMEGEDEVAMWERALKNKSRIIRRQAAKKLKLLTGRDYDWESQPR